MLVMIHVRQHEMGWKKIWIGVNQRELVIRCFLRVFENCRFVKCLIKVMVATTMLIYSRWELPIAIMKTAFVVFFWARKPHGYAHG